MRRHDKLLARFRRRPLDFTVEELRTLLRGLGYVEVTAGRIGAPRVAFYSAHTEHIIRLHRPHPVRHLRRYQVEYLLVELQRTGAI